jgi:hypothetical protein
MLTPENKLWIETAAEKLAVSEGSLLNGILRQIRTELGELSDVKTLEDWLSRSEHLNRKLEDTLSETKETLRSVEETVKATQLYLNQIQRSESYVMG